MAWSMICTLLAMLLFIFTPVCFSAIIQAAIEIDTGVDDILDLIVKKYDEEEKGQHTKKGTTDVATTLMKVLSSLSIRGNITEKSRCFTVNFQFQASSDTTVTTNTEQSSALIKKPEDEENAVIHWQGTGNIFYHAVDIFQPYVISTLILVFEGILGVIIGRIIERLA